MSTVADWDADVEALVISTVDAIEAAPERYASDLRRGRIEWDDIGPGESKFQIIHAPQGSRSANAWAASFAEVQTQVWIYRRLGMKAGPIRPGPLVPEEERDYTIGVIPKILFDLMLDAVWNALPSLHRIVQRPVASNPEVASYRVIGFSLALTVELAP